MSTNCEQKVVMNQTRRDATCKCLVLQKKIKFRMGPFVTYVRTWCQGEICCLVSGGINVIRWRVRFQVPVLFFESLTSFCSRSPVISVQVSTEFYMLAVHVMLVDLQSCKVLWFPHFIVHSLVLTTWMWRKQTVLMHLWVWILGISLEWVMSCFGFLASHHCLSFLYI